MQTKVAVIGILVGIAAGALIGGLIGHFATKANSSTGNDSGSTGANKGIDNTTPATIITVPPPDHAKYRKMILESVDKQRLSDVLSNISSKPHLAGSDENNLLADYIEDTWKSYGMKTFQDRYNVLLSYPGGEGERNRAEVLDRNGSLIYRCQEVEKVLDPIQNETEVVPPFNAYAKAGNVSSTKVYYVNYCRINDFKELEVISGVDFNGSIVICRYGNGFRGNKVSHAQQYGAIGAILYNDPSDYVDTSKTTADYNGTFPNSWFLPPSGAQRGSVYSDSGDPLTPGYPSADYANRKTVEQIRAEKLIPNIPTQPMGYEDAEQFMKELEGIGAEVPEAWRGGMPINYHYGGTLPDNKEFRIINNNKDTRANITNVFGVIEGSEEPDRYVVLGNHRDAWMFGATDAGSGTTIMMEVSRVFSLLKDAGWRPRRTIIFSSWGGEEYGIIGSIEWLESVKTLLDARGVAYLNCDSGVVYKQLLKAAASPVLFNLLHETAKLIPHPELAGQSLYDAWRDATVADTSNPNLKPSIGDLGSGSDHTGFYHRHGISSLDFNYYYDKRQIKIVGYYPCYHTTYETFKMVDLYVDPGFIYHEAMVQYWAEMVRTVSDSVIIPFVVTDYAVRLEEVYQILDDRVRAYIGASRHHYLTNLKSAVDNFKMKAQKFDTTAADADLNNWSEVRRINDQLMLLERSFLYPLGILDRKYIRHVIFAPSATDAYASAPFPGVIDALFITDINNPDDPNWNRVEEELTKAIYVVENAAKSLNPVTEVV